MRRLPVYPGGAFALRHREKKGGAARLDYSITMQRTNDESQSTFCICKAPGDRFLICCKAHLKKLPLSEDNISWLLGFGTAVKLLLLRSSNPFLLGTSEPHSAPKTALFNNLGCSYNPYLCSFTLLCWS